MSVIEMRVPLAVAATGTAALALAEAADAAWGVFEDRPTARAWLAGYFTAEAAGEEALARLRRELRGRVRLGAATRRVLPDADWREAYKAHFKPWRTGRLHWVPVWEKKRFRLPEGAVAVWLDPGMAFGTGNHETTRLCCERLVAFTQSRKPATGAGGRRGWQVLDAGCGSGILAISAARLGFRRVAGFDCDPDAVRISRTNARRNGLGGKVRFDVADLADGLAGRRAQLVLANIQADVLRRHARELVGAVAPGGWLVLSGILAEELAEVRTEFRKVTHGWLVDSRSSGEWSDLRLRRPR